MLPAEFVERVLRELGPDEGGALCRALTGEPSVSVRLNAAKGLAAPSGRPIGWSTGGYWLDARPSFTLDPDFHAGRYYVQEASSQFVGHIVAACGGIGGGRVLDLCAAPGGKTTLYSTLAGRGGLVVANEIVRNRAAVLADNVRKWGVGNVAVTVNDPSQVARLEGWFDAVAVDAPCSGEGMFRKSEEARTEGERGRRGAVRRTAARYSARSVAGPASRRIAVVQHLYLQLYGERRGTARLLGVGGRRDRTCRTDRGRSGVGRRVRRGGRFPDLPLLSPQGGGRGLFSRRRCANDAAGGERRRVPRPQRDPLAWADRRAVQELERWVEEPEAMRFAAVGGTFYGYWQPQAEAVAMLSGVLNVIASGVEMGQLFKGVLRPAHALALFTGCAAGRRPCASCRRRRRALPASRRGGCRPFRGRDESGDGRRCGAGIRQADRAPLQQSVSEFAQDTQRIGR